MNKVKAVAAVIIAASTIGVTACGGSSAPKSVNEANASSSAVTDTSVTFIKLSRPGVVFVSDAIVAF